MTEPKTRILVVDDDLRLRDLLQRYLTEQGFGVHTVPDAAGMDKLLGREREQVSFGNMTVNLATRTLERDGQSMSLTTGEFALLKVLVTNPRTPLSRDKLMELARGREYEVFDRSIDVQISRLRKLVEKD